MKFRFIPRNIINDIFDQQHIKTLLRDKNYEVIPDEPVPVEEIVTEGPMDVVLFNEPVMVEEEKEWVPESDDDKVELPKVTKRKKANKQ